MTRTHRQPEFAVRVSPAGLASAAPGLFRFLRSCCLFFGLALLPRCAGAAGVSDLESAMRTIRDAELRTETTQPVANVEIEKGGLRLELHEGRIAWLTPLPAGEDSIVFGGYFEGRGTLSFTAPISVEKAQLARFFASDSVLRPFDRALILFSGDVFAGHPADVPAAVKGFDKTSARQARDMLREFARDEEQFYAFELLRNIVHPETEPFVLVNVKPQRSPRLFIMHDPHRREEMTLWRHHDAPGESYMELVSSYSTEAASDRTGINGVSGEDLAARHYAIDTRISPLGRAVARAKVKFDVRRDSTRMAILNLHPDIQVTAVSDAQGRAIPFLGHSRKNGNSPALYLLLPEPATLGAPLELQFVYAGDIAREQVGYFYLSTGASWYPANLERQRATFDLTFHTPGQYEFVATGVLLDSTRAGDTLSTRWRVGLPARNVSFSIGPMRRYEFNRDGFGVDVYYSEELHDELSRAQVAQGTLTGRNMQEQVAQDVLGALGVFTDYFGPCAFDRLRVSEILSTHGEAFPGFLHMGVPTWMQTDSRGTQKVFRAHEVAHQWWGVDVGYETYRDQWLSEAFSEYSALLYLQAVEGSERLLDLLKDYREEVFSVRKYLLGSGQAAGAVALGYRTSTSATEGDYNLVVYKKGAFVLHMLRTLLIDLDTMAEGKFFGLMREFYRTYRGRDATTRDFEELVEKYYGSDMDWFFGQWVYGTDLPTYRFDYEIAKAPDGRFTVRGRIDVRDVEPGFRMYVPLKIELETGARLFYRFMVEDAAYTFEIPGLASPPLEVELNPFESVLARVEQ